MNICSLILVIILFVANANLAHAGLFSRNKPLKINSGSVQEVKEEERIQVLDTTDKLFLKRREQAYKLILEGKELIKKGEKRNNQNLIVKGRIKKEIGEKQLKAIRGRIEDKKAEDKNDEW